MQDVGSGVHAKMGLSHMQMPVVSGAASLDCGCADEQAIARALVLFPLVGCCTMPCKQFWTGLLECLSTIDISFAAVYLTCRSPISL